MSGLRNPTKEMEGIIGTANEDDGDAVDFQESYDEPLKGSSKRHQLSVNTKHNTELPEDDSIRDSQHDLDIMSSSSLDMMNSDEEEDAILNNAEFIGANKQTSTVLGKNTDPLATRTTATTSSVPTKLLDKVTDTSSSLPFTETHNQECSLQLEQEQELTVIGDETSEFQLRKQQIDMELQSLLRTTEMEELENGDTIDFEMAEALQKAAHKLCYRKKYYDVIKDKFLIFPSLAKTILNGTLFEAAQDVCVSDEYRKEGFPLLHIAAMRTIATEILAKEVHDIDDDDNDTSLRDRLASSIHSKNSISNQNTGNAFTITQKESSDPMGNTFSFFPEPTARSSAHDENTTTTAATPSRQVSNNMTSVETKAAFLLASMKSNHEGDVKEHILDDALLFVHDSAGDTTAQTSKTAGNAHPIKEERGDEVKEDAGERWEDDQEYLEITIHSTGSPRDGPVAIAKEDEFEEVTYHSTNVYIYTQKDDTVKEDITFHSSSERAATALAGEEDDENIVVEEEVFEDSLSAIPDDASSLPPIGVWNDVEDTVLNTESNEMSNESNLGRQGTEENVMSQPNHTWEAPAIEGGIPLTSSRLKQEIVQSSIQTEVNNTKGEAVAPDSMDEEVEAARAAAEKAKLWEQEKRVKNKGFIGGFLKGFLGSSSSMIPPADNLHDKNKENQKSSEEAPHEEKEAIISEIKEKAVFDIPESPSVTAIDNAANSPSEDASPKVAEPDTLHPLSLEVSTSAHSTVANDSHGAKVDEGPQPHIDVAEPDTYTIHDPIEGIPNTGTPFNMTNGQIPEPEQIDVVAPNARLYEASEARVQEMAGLEEPEQVGMTSGPAKAFVASPSTSTGSPRSRTPRNMTQLESILSMPPKSRNHEGRTTPVSNVKQLEPPASEIATKCFSRKADVELALLEALLQAPPSPSGSPVIIAATPEKTPELQQLEDVLLSSPPARIRDRHVRGSTQDLDLSKVLPKSSFSDSKSHFVETSRGNEMDRSDPPIYNEFRDKILSLERDIENIKEPRDVVSANVHIDQNSCLEPIPIMDESHTHEEKGSNDEMFAKRNSVNDEVRDMILDRSDHKASRDQSESPSTASDDDLGTAYKDLVSNATKQLEELRIEMEELKAIEAVSQSNSESEHDEFMQAQKRLEPPTGDPAKDQETAKKKTLSEDQNQNRGRRKGRKKRSPKQESDETERISNRSIDIDDPDHTLLDPDDHKTPKVVDPEGNFDMTNGETGLDVTETLSSKSPNHRSRSGLHRDPPASSSFPEEDDVKLCPREDPKGETDVTRHMSAQIEIEEEVDYVDYEAILRDPNDGEHYYHERNEFVEKIEEIVDRSVVDDYVSRDPSLSNDDFVSGEPLFDAIESCSIDRECTSEELKIRRGKSRELEEESRTHKTKEEDGWDDVPCNFCCRYIPHDWVVATSSFYGLRNNSKIRDREKKETLSATEGK